MLFSCLAPGAPIPGRFPGPPHPRGKHFTVDIHCHLLTEQAETMFREAGLVERRPRDVFANAHTREVNREQARRTRIQFTSVEKRLADMDHMGIDIQAITPAPNQTYYDTPPDLGIATARVDQRQHRRVVAAGIPIASSASARCRSRRPNSPLRNWNGCTSRSACAASRSPPTSPAPTCPRTASARSSPRPRNST